MAQMELWRRRDLEGMVKVEYLSGNLFSQDAGGNLIGLELYQGGEEYSGGGTVTANVIRADGGTVAVSGTISGNKASVTLPAACYAVVGVITIVIKLTVSGATTTIGAFVSNVYPSTTSAIVDPGTLVESVQDLIEDLEAAVASFADYSGLLAMIAPTFSPTEAYVAGRYVIHNDVLYRFKADHAAGSWVGTDADVVNAGSEISDIKRALRFNGEGTLIFPDWHQGNISSSGPTTNSKVIHTDPIPVGPYDLIYFHCRPTGDESIKICFYRTLSMETGSFIGWRDLEDDGYYALVYNTEATYVRFRIGSDTVNITPDMGNEKLTVSKFMQNDILESTGDTTDRTEEILQILNRYGKCVLGIGEFYVNAPYIPAGTTLLGSGIGKTKLIKNGTSASYTVRLRERCEIGNMTLSGYPEDIEAPETLGSGRIGVRIQGSGSANTQRFHCSIHDMEIINCDYAGVSIYGTGYSPESGCHLHNLFIRQCGYGIFFSSYAEFHVVTNINITFCTCGVGNMGGNNTFTGFNISRNTIGVLMDNTSGDYPNNAHGTFTGGSINHNSDYAIKVIKTVAGMIFSGINIFDGGIYVDDAVAVHFDCLNCGSDAPVVLNGSNPVFFTGCIFMTGESPISGNNTPIIVNCYTRDGTAWGQ